ncbi:ESX secretion-associated protein EspG [Nocardia sp. NPDC051990]|uniref:ESX secretion-associated protein EspG n=1 Tax=Nocardia sp. NPDC051990 TaxID=3155285 RepID=UPI00343ED7FA
MSSSWRFSDLEFVVIWESMRDGTVPPPFVYTSRTPIYQDYLREKAEARESLRSRLGQAFGSALVAMARPEIRIVVRGWDSRDPANPKGRISLLAVRRGNEGYLITQEAGETVWHSAGFTVEQCGALELAEVVARALPHSDAGTLDRLALDSVANPEADLDFRYGRSVAHELNYDPDRDRLQRFLSATPEAGGRIEVAQVGSRFGPRGVFRRALDWRDLAGDGRYAITEGCPRMAVGVDAKRLTSLINVEIAEVVRAIKDERR